MIAQIFGILLAMYFLVGRWSIDRLDGTGDVGPLIQQPRVWIVGMLAMWSLVIIGGRGRQIGRTYIKSIDLAICLFLGYMLLAAAWCSNTELAKDKAIEIVLLFTVAFAIAVSRNAFRHDKVLDGFWWAIVLVGVAMAALAIVNSTGGRIYAPGGGPNTFGRNMGLMALGAAYLSSRFGAKVAPISAAVMIVAVLLIMMSGSRGALLSTAIAILTLLITARSSLLTKFSTAGLIALAVAVLLFNTVTGKDALDVFQSRIVETTVYNQHLSARDDLWLDAFHWATERPWLGLGLNGYRANSWTYPHNIFLEVTVEGGCIGLLLLLNVGRAWWFQVTRSKFHIPRVPVAALALAFVASQTSGDLFDSRGVFLMLALAAPPVSVVIRSARRHPSVATKLPRRTVKMGTVVARHVRTCASLDNRRRAFAGELDCR